jgi:hypothetical protein
LRHLGDERHFGEVAIAEEHGFLAPQLEDAMDDRRVVPRLVAAEIGGHGRHGAMHLGTQRTVVRVLHDGDVAGHAQRELVAFAAVRRRGRLRRRDDVRRHAGELARIVDHLRPRVLGVEHVVVEFRGQLRELLLHRLEPCLAIGGQLRAAEAKVAQLVLDQPAPGRVERGEGRARGERAEALEQAHVLPEVRVEGRDLRQVRVVGVAQRRRVHDLVEIAHGGPCAVQVLEWLLRRHDHRFPRGGARVAGDGVDRAACCVEQRVDGRRDV